MSKGFRFYEFLEAQPFKRLKNTGIDEVYERYRLDRLHENVCKTDFSSKTPMAQRRRGREIRLYCPRASFKLGLNPYSYEILPFLEKKRIFKYQESDFERSEQKENIVVPFPTLEISDKLYLSKNSNEG
jgi:hypothetical protein